MVTDSRFGLAVLPLLLLLSACAGSLPQDGAPDTSSAETDNRLPPDPVHSALLPPGTRLLAIELDDGGRMTGTVLEESPTALRIRGVLGPKEIQKAEIRSATSGGT